MNPSIHIGTAMASVILGLCFRSPVPAGAPGAGWPEENRPDGINDELLLEHAMESSPATCHRKDSVVIRFLGDVMLHQAQIENTMTDDGVFDFSGYFRDIEKDLGEADLAVANMEFTLAGEPYTGYPAFSAPDSYVEYMADCGIDIFLTANNHILDKGEKGLERTLAVYRQIERDRGIRMTGSAENAETDTYTNPLFLSVKGVRLAFINFTYGTNTGFGKKYPGTRFADKDEITAAIRKAEKLDADCIIALPHWGEEYRTGHSEAQEELALWLAGNGVDLIVGSHPHVVQDTDTFTVEDAGGNVRNVPVIYSLGNAISNMSAPDTQIGLMLEARIHLDSHGEMEGISCIFHFLWSSLPGRLADTHTTVKVKDYIGHRGRWKQKYEYDKMVSTYCRIRKVTGITD